jgi:hypothetical protein
MQQVMIPMGFTSEECVREIAVTIMRMSEAIHHSLRQLASAPHDDHATTSPYALLTEEYALRARANMLLIEAKRLARPDFPASQAEVLDVLSKVETRLLQSSSLDELNELIASLILFTSSIVSRKNEIIGVLLENMNRTAARVDA